MSLVISTQAVNLWATMSLHCDWSILLGLQTNDSAFISRYLFIDITHLLLI